MESTRNGGLGQHLEISNKALEKKNLERKEIDLAVKNFLKKGGRIEILKPIDDQAAKRLLSEDNGIFSDQGLYTYEE